MTHTTGIEFKLRALRPLEVAAVDAALRELGIASRANSSGEHTDDYLDDADRSLARAGLGLRLRHDRSGKHLTVMTRAVADGGRFVRREIEAPWSRPESPMLARELDGAIRDSIEPFVLGRPLSTVLQLTTQRDVRHLARGDADLCELAIDRVTASAGGRTVTFQELELEVVDDAKANEQLAQALSQRLPVAAAADDKPTYAAVQLGMPLPPEPATSFGPDTPIGGAVLVLAQRHLAAMQHAEVDVRGDRGPEHLHTMRVALRALRSIVRAFRDLWPGAAVDPALERLREHGRQLGAVRDFDVLLGSLAAAHLRLPRALQPAADAAQQWMLGQRAIANSHLQEWLRSEPRLQELQGITAAIAGFDRTNPATAARTDATVAPRLARAAANLHQACAEIPADLPLEPLHALRITAKRLRYLAAEFSDLPGHDYGKSLAAVIALQQALGAVCDHENAARQLLEWVAPAAAAGADPLTTAAAMGALATRQAHAARRSRREAARALERVDRKRVWRRFPGGPNSDANVAP